MYCFEYATNSPFIDKIRGFNISKTALIKTRFIEDNFFSYQIIKFG
jgi:hypothetical protein